MCDKVVAPNVSLTSSVLQSKEAAKTAEKITEVIKSLPGQSVKPHSAGKRKKAIFYQDSSLEAQSKVDVKLGTEICTSLGKWEPEDLKLLHFVFYNSQLGISANLLFPYIFDRYRAACVY